MVLVTTNTVQLSGKFQLSIHSFVYVMNWEDTLLDVIWSEMILKIYAEVPITIFAQLVSVHLYSAHSNAR